MVRGAPGRGSSSSPSQPSRRNRRRHLPTVARVVPSWPATSVSLLPSADSSTIRARKASAWEVLERLSQRPGRAADPPMDPESVAYIGSPSSLPVNRSPCTPPPCSRRSTTCRSPDCTSCNPAPATSPARTNCAAPSPLPAPASTPASSSPTRNRSPWFDAIVFTGSEILIDRTNELPPETFDVGRFEGGDRIRATVHYPTVQTADRIVEFDRGHIALVFHHASPLTACHRKSKVVPDLSMGRYHQAFDICQVAPPACTSQGGPIALEYTWSESKRSR